MSLSAFRSPQASKLVEHQQHSSATTVTMSPHTQTPAVVRVSVPHRHLPLAPLAMEGPWSYGGKFSTCDAGACGRKVLHRYTCAPKIQTFVGQKNFQIVRGAYLSLAAGSMVAVSPLFAFARALRSLHLFTEEVMPAFSGSPAPTA